MKRLIPAIVLALLFAPAPAARAAEVAFPDTPPGRHARDYFIAFRAGEAAMGDYMTTHADAEGLRQRPVAARLEIYRRMRETHGELTPIRIDSASSHAIAVVVRDRQGEVLSFKFSCAEAPPHGLNGLSVEALGPGEESNESAAPLAGPPPTDEQIVAALSAELDSLSKAGAFSGAVLLDKGGKTLFRGAYGMASREAKRPNTLETRFDLGSINKKFTSLAIHQLAEAGKLGLDDPIARHLKDFPAENAGRITIRMLLEHRSGVRDVFRTPGLWDNPERLRTAGDWYRLVKDQPLDFEPGSRNAYSNGGYAVLGMIVERVSGQDYYEYIRAHVYRPAGMTRSDSFAANGIPADAAVGYTREPEGPRP